MTTRREFLSTSATGLAALIVGRRSARSAPITITVYKTPTCGCCKLWVAHMEKNGFSAVVHDLPNLDETKKTLRVPAALQSCHTAVVGAYWIEGHVPADLVKRLLAEKPALIGLAAPGMPEGSPGMETGKQPHFDVIAVDRAGKTRVYATR